MDPHLVTLSEYDPAAADQYQRVAFSLIAAAAERPLKRVLIASALQGDGRTCVLLNLAGALAQARRRVLVVDTDLRYPSVSRLLGLDVETGLTEALANGDRANDALCKVFRAASTCCRYRAVLKTPPNCWLRPISGDFWMPSTAITTSFFRFRAPAAGG